MIKKLKKNNGETLIEAMVSLLIAVLAMGLVASAVIAAARINQKTNEADKKFAKELESAELYSATTIESRKLTIKFDNDTYLYIGDESYTTVDVYGDGSMFASFKE